MSIITSHGVTVSYSLASERESKRTGPGKEFSQLRIEQKYLLSLDYKYPGSGWQEGMSALVNPTSFKENLNANYSLRPVLGLSHEVVQYIRTSSRKLSFELWSSYHLARQKLMDDFEKPADLLYYRNFLESLLVPASIGASPPLVAVVWPGANLYFRGVVDSLSIDYERFNPQGVLLEMKFNISFIEVATSLMTSDKVQRNGLGYQAYGANSGTAGMGGSSVAQRAFKFF